MQYIGDLDWHTLRLGAFHVLAQMGERSIDTREALLTRFQGILFNKIYQDEPAFETFRPRLDEDTFERISERAHDIRPSPAAAIMPTESATPWFFTVEPWQADARLPAPGVGPIAEDHAARYLDLGKKLGIFTPTNAVSERGEVLRSFYSADHGGREIDPRSPEPNPIHIDTLASKVMFIDALLREDALTPLMLLEFVDAPDAGIARAHRRVGGEDRPELLMKAAQRLYDILGVDPDVYMALELQRLRKYLDNISVKKNHLNQALPRMEFAVNLDLVDRGVAAKRSREPVYRPTDTTRRFAAAFARFKTDPAGAQDTLDEYLFGGIAAVYGLKTEPVTSDDERLYWFCKGYKLVKRPAGFTPGRTAGLAGAIMSLRSGRLVELSVMFEAVYRAAHGPWGNQLGFSGGSRIDREFLIRIDEKLEHKLEAEIGDIVRPG